MVFNPIVHGLFGNGATLEGEGGRVKIARWQSAYLGPERGGNCPKPIIFYSLCVLTLS